jgi:hypothetical protein
LPSDATEWDDADGDTYGDNSDVFPTDPAEWNDTDMDGVGDNADRFPDDNNEWNDSDEDGCGDNSDVFPNDPTECLDSDGDGTGDRADAFPMDASETSDKDGDGVGDNSDAFPNNPRARYDTDGDGVANANDAFPRVGGLTTWSQGAVVLLVPLLIFGALAFTRRRTPAGDKAPPEISLNLTPFHEPERVDMLPVHQSFVSPEESLHTHQGTNEQPEGLPNIMEHIQPVAPIEAGPEASIGDGAQPHEGPSKPEIHDPTSHETEDVWSDVNDDWSVHEDPNDGWP